jgi:hypothetical protein
MKPLRLIGKRFDQRFQRVRTFSFVFHTSENRKHIAEHARLHQMNRPRAHRPFPMHPPQAFFPFPLPFSASDCTDPKQSKQMPPFISMFIEIILASVSIFVNINFS